MPLTAELYNNIKLLSEYNLKKYVLSEYNLQNCELEQIKIKNTEKQRAVYKVTYLKKSYCLKKVYFNVHDLLFVYSGVEWFYRYGINVPQILPTKNYNRFVTFENMLFILTPWIEGVKCDYDNKEHMLKAMSNLAKMHNSTKNFTPILGSSCNENYSDICSSINKRYHMLLKNSNSAFIYGDKFSKLYLNHFDENEKLGKLSSQISYFINPNNLTRSLCHLDYVNKNLLFDTSNNIWVIDFDKCRMDYCVHDISYFFRRFLKRDATNWNFDLTLECLVEYEKFQQLNLDDYLYILVYLAFPQKYWRISRDYYNNIDKCNKNSFINLLTKAIKNENEQYEFAMNFIAYMEDRFSVKIK